jgi:integrase
MATKLTKSFIDGRPYTEVRTIYWDTTLKGFGLRVGSHSKTYIAESKIGRKTVRVTIGRHGVFTPEEARTEARQLLGLMARGINPNDLEREKRARTVTLGEAFADYMAARKSLKPNTIRDYTKCMNVYFKDWKNKPLLEITKEMVAKRHSRLGETSQAQANLAMRFLRALFYFATGQYEDNQGRALITENPVRRISQTRAWFRVERRQSVLKPHDIRPWFQAVMNLRDDHTTKNRQAFRDYLLLLLFTGLRRQEALPLKWENVDFRGRTLSVFDTKNRDNHTLPLSDFLVTLLQRRLDESQGNPYVFPGEGARGHLTEPRKQILRVAKESGVSFTSHDLRRTFITLAESLDIPVYAVKRLANHKISNDVTAGYVINDVERLRGPMQKITDRILRYADVGDTAEIIPIKPISEEAVA